MSIHEFTPTGEQQAIIDEFTRPGGARKLAVQAYAGAGKSSSIKLMANSSRERGLYLVFNKRNAEEAKRAMPRHVEPRTVHSLAYRAFGADYRHKFGRITGRQLALDLDIGGFQDLSPAHVARAVQQAIRRYCQSADDELSLGHCRDGDGAELIRRKAKRELMVLPMPEQQLTDRVNERVKADMARYQAYVLRKARQLWPRWVDVSDPMPVEHDLYVKLFQLSEPVIRGFDWIAVDEAQDSNDVTLDIVNRQAGHCKVLYIGDRYQAIYGWRGAVNAMDQLDGFHELYLSQSFRFGEAVAEIANSVLKQRFDLPVPVRGNPHRASTLGAIDYSRPYAVIARSNKTLLDEALSLLDEQREFAVIGGTADMAKLLESIYWLQEGDRGGVTHPEIQLFQDWDDLVDEAEADAQLKRLAELVGTLKHSTLATAERLRRMDRNDPASAPVVLSTAHKSKGLEFSQVQIADDFCRWNPSQWKPDMAGDEDWRILYVAATRALDRLQPNQLIEELG